jgi:hypothetical protein
MTSIDTVVVFAAGIAIIGYGRHLRRKSHRESEERIRRMIEEHQKRTTRSSGTEGT